MNVWAALYQLGRMSAFDFAEKVLVVVLAKFIYIDALKCMILTMQTVDQSMLSRKLSYEEKFLSESECLYFARNYDTNMREDVIRQNFSKGDSCYAFIKKREIVSYGWYSTSVMKLPNSLILNFDPSYVYMYQGYTRNAYRGEGLHGIGMARALKFYCYQGYKGIVSYVDARNYKSLRSVYRLGYQIFGRVYVIRIRNKFFIWRSAGCKKYGLTVTKRE